MIRRLSLAVLTVVIFAIASGVVARPAAAVPFVGDCAGVPESKQPPVPAMPYDSGLISGLVKHDPNVTGDPFAPGATVSIVDQYGYAGMDWHTYDLGCGGDLADPLAAFHTQFANIMNLVPNTGLQLLAWVGDTIGSAEWIKTFDKVFETLAHGIAVGPFLILFPVASGVLGFLIAKKAGKQATADVLSDVAWWAGLGIGAVILLTAPTWAARQTDEVFDFGMAAVRSSFGATAGPLTDIGPVYRDTRYTAFCTGEFGSAESPAAQRYCTDLFKAQAFSWQELREMNQDPKNYSDAVARKQATWKEIAQHVHDEYPSSYYDLQGKNGSTRPVAAFVASVDVWILGWFLLWAGITFVVARFTIRTVILVMPLATIIGVLPKQRHRMFALWGTLTAAMIRAVVSLFAAGLVSVLIGAMRAAPETSQFTRLVASGLVSYAAWKVAAPFRHAGMIGGEAKRAHHKVRAFALSALASKVGAEAGVKAAIGMTPRVDTPSSDPGPRPDGYDLGHARTRDAGTGMGGAYRPAGEPSPLRSGMSAIDAVPTSEDGETVYRARPRTDTKHRRVNHDDVSHARTRERADTAPTRGD